MNWNDAVQAMLAGAAVQRQSDQDCRLVEAGPVPIHDMGREPCMLAHAWTHDEKPVRVFLGAWSKALYVPETDDMDAEDWVVVSDHG